MKKTIGILGGMGPLATADLYRKIVESTAAEGDSGHIRVYIDSNTAIPDRTAAILSGGPDPVPEMLSALRNLEKCGADCIIMPCNTAHYFLPRLRTQTVLPILDMPAITAQRCAELFPGKRACVLARDELMRLIYDVVKASRPLAPEEESWHALLAALRDRGAETFILGCTELPILAEALPDPGPFVDPTLELARAAIRFCGYEVKA